MRYSKTPPLNFDANNYTELIDWQGSKVTEPPLSENMTDEDIKNHIFQKTKIASENFPCHPQAIERLIKDIWIYEVQTSYIPSFDSKADFQL